VDEALSALVVGTSDASADRVVQTLDDSVGTTVPVHKWTQDGLLQEASAQPALSQQAEGMARRHLGEG
jgi:hypothetical protein